MDIDGIENRDALARFASEELVHELLRRIENKALKLDPHRGLLRRDLEDTPERIVRSWEELFGGYRCDENDVKDMLKLFPGTNQSSIIVVRDIPFTSTCEHHMLPFWGTVDIAYKPSDNMVIGISTLPRLVDVFARRLQVQEHLTDQICKALAEGYVPKTNGAAVRLRGQHLCLATRGAKMPGVQMETHSYMGNFGQQCWGAI